MPRSRLFVGIQGGITNGFGGVRGLNIGMDIHALRSKCLIIHPTFHLMNEGRMNEGRMNGKVYRSPRGQIGFQYDL